MKLRLFKQEIRDPFSSISHLVGAALGIIALPILVGKGQGKALNEIAFVVYLMALIFLLSASGIYHALRGGTNSDLWQKLDHVGIYVLIWGTYVPICLLALPTTIGIPILVLETLLATVGVIATLSLSRTPTLLRLTLYLLMGWMAVCAFRYIGSTWPSEAETLLLAGGVIYSLGAIVYSTNKPNLIPGRFSAHDLWHVLVLAGCACHFALIFSYVPIGTSA